MYGVAASILLFKEIRPQLQQTLNLSSKMPKAKKSDDTKGKGKNKV